MELLRECEVQCPYCGEPIINPAMNIVGLTVRHRDVPPSAEGWRVNSLLVDCSCAEQSYSEDCQVCCRPIQVAVWIDEDFNPHLELQREDE